MPSRPRCHPSRGRLMRTRRGWLAPFQTQQRLRIGCQPMHSQCAADRLSTRTTSQAVHRLRQPTQLLPIMKLRTCLTKNTVIFGGAAAWGLLLVSCISVNRTVLAPPFIAGAKFVGNKECVECHEPQTGHFGSSTHAKVTLADGKLGSTGCEACHGAGSIHSKDGGSKHTIVNPRKSPEACYQCHLEKRGEFSLANSHRVADGHMSCGDCHNPHEGNTIGGRGASLESANDTCTKCHTAQKGPFVF